MKEKLTNPINSTITVRNCMKLTNLDRQLQIQFLLQGHAFSIACQILSNIFSKIDPTGQTTTYEQIASVIGDKAYLIVASLSDEEIQKELEECDRTIELSKQNGNGAVLSLDAASGIKEVIWSKRHGFN